MKKSLHSGLLVLALLVSARSEDLRLAYVSAVDGSTQPYRLYVPGGYDGKRQYPLVVALHGTAGNQNTFFDDARYQQRSIREAADRRQMLVVCPHGRGPREYRGAAEHDVFSVMAEVERKFKVDPDRVYITGHSMGGTGAAYLALHHPDVFAAAAPLSAAYGWPWLAPNARHVPFWWVSGGLDRSWFLFGTNLGVEGMRAAGAAVQQTILETGDHYGPVRDMDAVLAWMGRHRLVRHPREYTFVVDTPLHGQAYWTRVEALLHPGRPAQLSVRRAESRIEIRTANISSFAVLHDPVLMPPERAFTVDVDGHNAFKGTIPAGKELQLRLKNGNWVAAPAPAGTRRLTDWRFTPVGIAPRPLSMSGVEAPLANWITDAMRAATGADMAIINRVHYRGFPIPAGQVDMTDVLEAMGPWDWQLIVARLSGADLLAILDENVADPDKQYRYSMNGPEADRLIQLSGAWYGFDRSRPPGQRIVSTSLRPGKVYSVALEGHTAQRESGMLAERFLKGNIEPTDIPLSAALYGFAARQGRIEARVEGRVREASAAAK